MQAEKKLYFVRQGIVRYNFPCPYQDYFAQLNNKPKWPQKLANFRLASAIKGLGDPPMWLSSVHKSSEGKLVVSDSRQK